MQAPMFLAVVLLGVLAAHLPAATASSKKSKWVTLDFCGIGNSSNTQYPAAFENGAVLGVRWDYYAWDRQNDPQPTTQSLGEQLWKAEGIAVFVDCCNVVETLNYRFLSDNATMQLTGGGQFGVPNMPVPRAIIGGTGRFVGATGQGVANLNCDALGNCLLCGALKWKIV